LPLSSWSAVLDWHCQRYPLLRAQDIYKLVRQGVFGPGHIIASAAAARRALEGEMAALKGKGQKLKAKGQNPDEELLEPIDPNERMVRVNLRPLAATQCKVQNAGCKMQDAGWLVAAMVESTRRVQGDPEQMRRRLTAAVRWCRKNLPRQAAQLERMAARAEESGYPAFHHSQAYSRAYRPAYRVILSDCLKPRASDRAG
jgi:hypothetical protein